MTLLPPLTTPDGRRAWAFAGVMGGCITFTLFAAAAVWLVSGNARYSLYLGLAAHVQILVGMTALGAQFVKRTIKAGRDGVEITDHEDVIHDGDSITIAKEPVE